MGLYVWEVSFMRYRSGSISGDFDFLFRGRFPTIGHSHFQSVLNI
jgi:hypothetical protein